jgi:transmembrane sensor
VVSLNFQKYEEYCSEDFATDLYFSQWIQAPENLTVSYFWENFLKKYPNKIHEIELARHKLLKPNTFSNHFSQQDIESLWHQINVTITTI